MNVKVNFHRFHGIEGKYLYFKEIALHHIYLVNIFKYKNMFSMAAAISTKIP